MPAEAPRRDESLVTALAAGDPGALTELMHRYQRPLYGYLVRMLGSREDADDVFQETFLRVVRHAGRFDPSRRFRPWVYAIASNLIKNTYRARGNRASQSLEPHDEEGPSLLSTLVGRSREPSEAAQREESAERVRSAVERLPEKGRNALVLFYYQGLPYAEIAEVLEVPVGTVKSRIHNALGKLGHELASKEGLS
ncbi:MAG: sigma-70 family RNA polymerase sigma factor [Planctomycetes bacterium]|nr:sigma-70 family RNA polymerase sigma factor [Planctomycetota bacterium]